MNKLARQLNMNDTNFTQPAGLDDGAYSSASDMAKMMSYALKDKTFIKLIGHASYEYTAPEGYRHTFTNSNRLITQEMFYPGIIGGKTGFTPETPEGGAGHCLIVAAERNGHTVIAAVYRTYSQTPQASAEVAKAALDYAFNNYTWQEITR
jgi:D-alanyl-D-alanine carboxypeptidase